MPSRRRPRITFETIQHSISRAKIILVEIASLIALAYVLYHGLKIEMKW